MSVSIIIPNYNGEELLKGNLPKVFEAKKAYSDGKVEIIVVDDCSKDDSLSILRQFDIKVIRNEKNLGFSTTVNRGVKEAQGEIVVLLNTDVVPEKDFLAPLLSHFEDPNVFAVGCLDKSIEKGKVVLRGRGIGKFKKGFLMHHRGEVNRNDTLWVSGGSGAFRKDLWLNLGGFDSLYNPFYWEDIDLSYRALKAGYKIIFEPKSIVIHEHEVGSIKKHYKNFQIRIIAYRNQFIFVWKDITDIDKQLLHALWLPYHFIKAILSGDLYFFIGFLQAFLKLPKIIQSSFQAQKLFVKSDRELLD